MFQGSGSVGVFFCHRSAARRLLVLLAVAAVCGILASPALAQGLNWEGQAGAFITPFAYTSASSVKGFGRPQASFHFLEAGSVIGGYVQTSVTVGFFKRAEFGNTAPGVDLRASGQFAMGVS